MCDNSDGDSRDNYDESNIMLPKTFPESSKILSEEWFERFKDSTEMAIDLAPGS